MKSTIEIIKNSDGTETLKIIDETGRESKESERSLGIDEYNLRNENCVVYFHKRVSDNLIFYVGIGDKYRPNNKSKRSDFWKKYTSKYPYEVEIIHRN